jgi:hypothetical protein
MEREAGVHSRVMTGALIAASQEDVRSKKLNAGLNASTCQWGTLGHDAVCIRRGKWVRLHRTSPGAALGFAEPFRSRLWDKSGRCQAEGVEGNVKIADEWETAQFRLTEGGGGCRVAV